MTEPTFPNVLVNNVKLLLELVRRTDTLSYPLISGDQACENSFVVAGTMLEVRTELGRLPVNTK